MKYLVTGGAGFIGSHVANLLIQRGHAAAIIDNLSTGSRKNVHPKARLYKLDIKSRKVGDVFKKERPEAVFHFAAQTDVRKSVQNPRDDATHNILGSLNVLENCVKYKVKKVIFASTGGAIYGDAQIVPTPESYTAHPISPYGVAKLAVEHYLYYYHKVYGLPFVSLRFSNVYGPRQNPHGETGVVAIFTHALLSGSAPILYGSGKQTRDFVFVEDVAEAALKALQGKAVGTFNIGTGKETPIQELFSALQRIAGSARKAKKGPARSGEQQRSCLDCSEAKKVFGWSYNHSLDQGLQKTVDFFQVDTSVPL